MKCTIMTQAYVHLHLVFHPANATAFSAYMQSHDYAEQMQAVQT
jgi:hypothetical protein